MRTTLTLDPDLGRQLEDRMRRTGKSFRETVNEVIRLGLAVRSKRRERFVVKPRRLGLKPGLDPARLHELDSEAEVDRFLSLTRKLSER